MTFKGASTLEDGLWKMSLAVKCAPYKDPDSWFSSPLLLSSLLGFNFIKKHMASKINICLVSCRMYPQRGNITINHKKGALPKHSCVLHCLSKCCITLEADQLPFH